MDTSLQALFTRGFLPTWFALAGIVAVQMIGLVALPESPDARPMQWSPMASIVALVVLGTLVASWALARTRAMALLIGAMSVTLLAMRHALVGFHAPVPPASELFAFYTVAAVLLAAGAYERARFIRPS